MGKYLIKRVYAFSGQKAVRNEKKNRTISRSTMPCGPLKQYNKFQLAYRYRTVSTLASYSFPVFLPYAKHNTEHICVSQHSVVTLCLSTRYILQSKIFRFSYAVPIGSLLAPHNDRPTLYHCPFLLLAQFSLSLSLSHSLPLLPSTTHH